MPLVVGTRELTGARRSEAALGFRLLDNSSVELVHHYYRQVQAAQFLRDDRLRAQPCGTSKDIGHELDLVVGLEEWDRIEIELVEYGAATV